MRQDKRTRERLSRRCISLHFSQRCIALLFPLLAAGCFAQSGKVPLIHINTDGGKNVTSKTEYVDATFYIDHAGAMNAGSADKPLAMQIRGRGHSSWKGAKKPYKIRLADKAPLLGMSKHRHWALLKFHEPTLAGFELGRMLEMDWTPSVRPVELVLNGDYQGLYWLAETNRISKNRLDIYEQPDMNTDEETVGGGWLVEVDNYYESNSISIRENTSWDMRITLHSPETLSTLQRSWLKTEFERINSEIYDPCKAGSAWEEGFAKASSAWEESLDAGAMARYFIVQEVMDNPDGFHGSFYLHKDLGPDARWTAGPLWDMNCMQRAKTDYTFRMKVSYTFTPHWIGELIKDDNFCQTVRHEWRKFYPDKVEEWLERLDQMLELDEAWEANKSRWADSNQTPLAQKVQSLKDALRRNAEWLDTHLPGTAATETASTTSPDPSVPSPEHPATNKTAAHNLQGQKVSDGFKGIVIKNGKKVLVR